jgi:hypothetical protein
MEPAKERGASEPGRTESHSEITDRMPFAPGERSADCECAKEGEERAADPLQQAERVWADRCSSGKCDQPERGDCGAVSDRIGAGERERASAATAKGD